MKTARERVLPGRSNVTRSFFGFGVGEAAGFAVGVGEAAGFIVAGVGEAIGAGDDIGAGDFIGAGDDMGAGEAIGVAIGAGVDALIGMGAMPVCLRTSSSNFFAPLRSAEVPRAGTFVQSSLPAVIGIVSSDLVERRSRSSSEPSLPSTTMLKFIQAVPVAFTPRLSYWMSSTNCARITPSTPSAFASAAALSA
jgi:hypothetical protein